MYCKICGEPDCKKHSVLLGKPKNITDFAGSSPPEIFVGRWNYPNVYAGILSPEEFGDTRIFSSHELWHKNKSSIPDILSFRNKLIYGRSVVNIKTDNNRLRPIINEVAMTSKSISTEFHLKKPPKENKENDPRVPLIKRAADVYSVRLQENPLVLPKVDYLVNDNEVKSTQAIKELAHSNIETSTIIKILSAGLLGMKKNRKMVPTRWAITAVDDTLSKQKLKSIKNFPEINEYQVFHSEYLGNHYEFLLIPDNFSFEVIEISLKSSGIWQDYETIFGRKNYADDVTGAYYANRLALCEHLEKIKRQATCIVFREIKPEYYAPLGVGILREISREAFSKKPEIFNSREEALKSIQTRLVAPVKSYTEKSVLLKNNREQTKLFDFK